MLRCILGFILKFESAFLLLPSVVGLIYQEKQGIAYVLTAIICLVLGHILTKKKPASSTLYTREGFVTVALSWIVMSIFGAVKRQDEGMKILQLDGSKLNSLIDHHCNHTILSVLGKYEFNKI